MEKHECIIEDRVRSVETQQAEMRVYIRDIREDIQEIKSSIKEFRPVANCPRNADEPSKLWPLVVAELIKLVGLCITILGSIIGALKILGR